MSIYFGFFALITYEAYGYIVLFVNYIAFLSLQVAYLSPGGVLLSLTWNPGGGPPL